MRHRAFLLVTGSLLATGGLFGLACSSPSPIPGVDDAGPDVTTGDAKPDGVGPDGSKTDGGTDGSVPVCTTNPIPGTCDLVSQNCQAGNECVMVNSPDGGSSTECQPIGSGALVKGSTCVSGNSNPCVKGTTCISGRCAPACCFGDDSTCGNSVPEGFTGECNLNVVDKAANKLFSACTYNAACKPFGVQPCPTDYTCLVKDTSGTSACSTIFNPPGLAEGASCGSANACKDGMMCISTGDAGSVCTYVCYKGGGPFDAGISSGPSGKGGCTLLKKTCGGTITGLPTWLGICQ
jgi:hypothetical protein